MDIIPRIDNIFSYLAFMGVLALSWTAVRRRNGKADLTDDRLKYLIAEHERRCTNIIRIEQRLGAIEQRLDEIWQFLAKGR